MHTNRRSSPVHTFSCVTIAYVLAASTSCSPSGPSPAESLTQKPTMGLAELEQQNLVGPPTVAHEGGSIINPAYLSPAESERFLQDDDTVFVIHAEEGTFAYPRVFLSASHVVNGTLDGVPVLLSYCQLSDCVRVHSRVVDGGPLSFAWMRSLYNGTLVLTDTETHSVWVQFIGKCLRGSMRGRELEEVTTPTKMSWRAARAIPDLRVLEPLLEVEACRDFMAEMDTERLGATTLGMVRRPDSRLTPYTRGLGISVRGESRFLPLDELHERGLVELSVGGWTILVVSAPESKELRVFRRHLDGRVLDFELHGDRLEDEQTGSRWDLEGRCVGGALISRSLTRPLYVQCFWFAWSAFYPTTQL